MTKTMTTTVTTVLLLSLSACGGGGASDAASAQSKKDAKASASISDSLVKGQQAAGAGQFFSMKRKDADCIGNGLVDKIGTEQLQTYQLLGKELKAKSSGVTDVKMSAGDAKAATGVLFGCADVENMMKTAIGKSGNVPAAMKTCVDKTLSEDNLRPMFTKIFQGRQEAAQKELIQPMIKCAKGSQGSR